MSRDVESWENPIFDNGDDGAAVRRNPLFEDEESDDESDSRPCGCWHTRRQPF